MTGWQQRKDALADAIPGALHFEYAGYENVEAMFLALPHAPDVAVGWSLADSCWRARWRGGI